MNFKGLHSVVCLLGVSQFLSMTSALPCQPVECFVNPCDVSSCPAFLSNAECSTDYCGGCNAKWTMDGVDVTEMCLISSQSGASLPSSALTSVQTAPVKKMPTLPKLSVPMTSALPCQPVECLMNPCDASSCPAFSSSAECSTDYCGGCSAKWTMDGVDVTETCLKSIQSGASLPNVFISAQPALVKKMPTMPKLSVGLVKVGGVADKQQGAQPCQRMRCLMNPCVVSSCPAFSSQAVCSTDYCGGCNAKWTMDGVDVTETCLKSIQSGASLPSSALTSVQTAPVKEIATLPKFPVSLVKIGRVADKQQGAQPCQRMRCFMNPCVVSSCPAFSSQAVCSPNFCSGCYATWTMDGVDVTETCVKSAIEERIRSPFASSLNAGSTPVLSNGQPLKIETRARSLNLRRFRNRATERSSANTPRRMSRLSALRNGQTQRNGFFQFFPQ